jgi:hypothetical protein
MAVKITTDGYVKTVKPFRSYFNLHDLEEEVGGMIEPIKIGPVWVIYSEDARKLGLPLNKVASFFFEVAIHGSVVVVPPQQLPPEWDIMDENDYIYTSEQVDDGFLISLQRALINSMNMPLYTQNPFPMKEEFSFRPPNELAADDENTRDFYRQVCDKPINIDKFKKDGIILEESEVVIMVKEHTDKIKMIDQMIEFHLETEEYEKCAKLKEIKHELEGSQP